MSIFLRIPFLFRTSSKPKKIKDMTTKELGDLGELKALQYLRKKRLQIIETNYRFHRNEVDIIYKLPGKVVFVEVKTRQTAEIGPPWKSVTRHKQKQIIDRKSVV